MASHELQIFITGDGSPTLVSTTDENYTEKMHHSGGAWSETLYIYLPAMKTATQSGHLHLMSLGLGLGYNEIIAATLHLKAYKDLPLSIVSFEISEQLRMEFLSFFESDSLKEPNMFSQCYQAIVKLCADEFQIDAHEIKSYISKLLQTGQLQVRQAYPESLTAKDQFNCILYDAFSNKMNPELWTEEFLKGHLGKISEEKCVFSTYAATGTVKRALKFLGFQKIERPGFSGKRDSSFYLRGLIFA